MTSQRDPKNIYHMMPVADLEKLTPAIDWKKFFADTGTPPMTELNVTYPPFFKALNSLLDSTSLETIKLYLQWQVINSIPSTGAAAGSRRRALQFLRQGFCAASPSSARAGNAACRQPMARWARRWARSTWPRRFRLPARRPRCRWCTTSKRAMDQDIDTLDWMSPETKVKAKEKLQAVANKIGYPDKWRDYSSLEDRARRCRWATPIRGHRI